MQRFLAFVFGLMSLNQAISQVRSAPPTFRLHLRFVVPYTENSWSQPTLESWIENRLQLAEELYDQIPALKISYEIARIDQQKNINLQSLVFLSEKDFGRKMKKHFPPSAPTDSLDARFVVILSEKLQILKPQKRLCGKIYPRRAGLIFGKKQGMILQRYCAVAVFPHLLGHIFRLKHTYRRSPPFAKKCHKGLKKGKKNKRLTANYQKRTINLMDEPIEGFKVYLNPCQTKKASKTRLHYLLKNARINAQK